MPKKKRMLNKEEMIVKLKIFCPICGSAAIRPSIKKKFRCLNCKAIFYEPKRTQIKIRKRPRYIG